MSRTLDLLDDSFPHGSAEGYRAGCRGSHCPSLISCRDVRIRSASDRTFRTRLEEGMTLAQILAAEAADEAALRSRATKAPTIAPKRRKPRPIGRITPEELVTIRRMNAAGKTDTEIAEQLGRPLATVYQRRSNMGLPRRTKTKPRRHGTPAGYNAGCRDDSCPVTPSCHDAAKAKWRAQARPS